MRPSGQCVGETLGGDTDAAGRPKRAALQHTKQGRAARPHSCTLTESRRHQSKNDSPDQEGAIFRQRRLHFCPTR